MITFEGYNLGVRNYSTPAFEQAILVALTAHEAVGQRRKYSGVPYITHPVAVAQMLRGHESASDDMMVAAILHDVVEDTKLTLHFIREMFGETVAQLVFGLTKASRPEDGNRAKRKEIDLAFLAKQDWRVHTIKCYDRIHNLEGMCEEAPEFCAKTYIPESVDLLNVLMKATVSARELLRYTISESKKVIKLTA